MKRFLLITATHALAQVAPTNTVNHEQWQPVHIMPTMDIELAAPPIEEGAPLRENSIARPFPEKEEVAKFIFRAAREPYKPPSPGFVLGF